MLRCKMKISFLLVRQWSLGAALVLLTLLSARSPAIAQTVRFIFMSDFHFPAGDSTVTKEIVQEAINRNVNFVLVGGDLSDDGEEWELASCRRILQPLYDHGIGVYPIRGNHDWYNPDSKTAWDDVFTGTYALPQNGPSGETNLTYSFTYGNVFVVGLDEYVNPHRVNQTWLTGQLNSNTQPHVFVFGHEPAFKYWADTCLDQYPSQRNTFWNSIKAGGAHVYLCGHDHIYTHARIDDGDGDTTNDVHQFVAPPGGGEVGRTGGAYNGNNSPFTPIGIYVDYQYYFGYVLVEINGMVETLTEMARTGTATYTQNDTYAITVVPNNALANIKVFLQGPYNGSGMSTALNSAGYVPLTQPYSGAPWNYSGTESVTSVPSGVVDWVLLELRTGTPASTNVATRAAFLKSDGSVVDLDGTSQVSFKVAPGSYYIVVRHRNHIAVMSAGAVSLSSSSTLYDFTTAQTQAYGTNPMKDLGSGKFGMIGGDGNGDGGVYAEDYTLYRTHQGNLGYQAADYNLDGGVYAEDYTMYRVNQGKATQVP
jgi:predicted phosphodiesterase